MAAPRLNFADEEERRKEEEQRKRGYVPPPPRKHWSFDDLAAEEKKRRALAPPDPIRDPKKHSIFSNLWSGLESIPGGVKDQEETLRHAVASDIATGHGAFGLVSTPASMMVQASKYVITGDKKDLEKLKKMPLRPWEHERSALDKAAEPIVKESYETTRRATGTRGLKKFEEIWHDNPVAAIGGVAVLAPPAFRLAGITKMSKAIRAANEVPLKGGGTRRMTKTEAVKAATVETYYPGSLDKLGIQGSPFTPRFSGRRISRTPTGRAAQKAFDWASEKIDEGVGVGERRTGPDTPLSKTRREAAGKRRADDLNRSRLVTNAMRHVSTFADYLNDGLGERLGTAFGRRKETLAARDAAVGAALHASTEVDPVEAVRLAAEDTKQILQSGRRDAHNGDIGDVPPDKREGQTVYVSHGMDEEGNPLREQATVTADHGDRVTVTTPDGGERTIPHARAHLLGPNGEGDIPLNKDEIAMLERRYDHLTYAHEELTSEPRLEAKFRAAVQTMTDLGQMNEQLGVDYFTRGLDPTGSEALGIRERLDARRNQFLGRLGGEGAQIDYYSGLWGQLQNAMQKSGKYTDEQQLVFMSVLDRQARLWANEVEGRDPADYLASPEGANLGGIDFSNSADLEATANRFFQTEGERFSLVKRLTTAVIKADPQVGDLVSTPKGMGWVKNITDVSEPDGRVVRIEMAEGGHVTRDFNIGEVRVSEFPWTGHPQPDDYVITPDGPGRVERTVEGPGPDFDTFYEVTLFDEVNGMFVDGERRTFAPGQVQRVEDPRDLDSEVFHLASQQALGTPGFPKKATSEQYLKELSKQGVKSDEFFWMGLSRRPIMEDQLRAAEAEVKAVEKRLAADPGHDAVYGAEERDRALLEVQRWQAILADYTVNPDPNFILDANWTTGSFPVAALEDAVKSSSNFLNVKETLYSSEAGSYQWRDKWGPNRDSGDTDGGLIIREPHSREPYYELVMALPESDLYTHGHYTRHGNESHLLHIRFHEITDLEGNKALLIDELQSDWNNVGRSHGWKGLLSPLDERTLRHLRDRERRILAIRQAYLDRLGVNHHQIFDYYDNAMREAQSQLNNEIDQRNQARFDAREAMGLDVGPTPDDPNEPLLYVHSNNDVPAIRQRADENHVGDATYQSMMEARDKVLSYNERATAARSAADSIEGSSHGTNRGPLVMGDGPKYLGMKRLIRWAADHGQTRIIWVRGHEQGVRYSLFNDLPIQERHGASGAGDPEDHGNTFYYPYNNEIIDAGGYYQDIGGNTGLSEGVLQEMRNVPPMEVRWDNPDLDEDFTGEQYILIPRSSLRENPGLSGQTMLGQEDVLPPPYSSYGAPHQFPRYGKVIRDDGETMLVKPLDPEWDPARLRVDFRGDTGESDYSHFDINIVNRAGVSIFNDSVDGQIGRDLDSVLAAVGDSWERQIRYRYMEGGDAVPANVAAKNAEVAKMYDTLDALRGTPHVGSEFERMIDNADHALDEYAWDDYVAEHASEYGDREAEGDFREIRDHESRGHRRIRELQADLARVKEKQALDRERGVETQDYAAQIEATEREIASAKEYLPNKGHSYGYDVMLPKIAKELLKPYKNEADISPVELQQEVYTGRYSSETHGVITNEGPMHGWVMKLPKKMIEDAKDTQGLFQRGNDIVKGASTWVGGPEGKRFIALTEHADFSTLMHEFIGHATEEMKRRYPELWETVERDMGKPLEDWKVADHERFAKWVERYWMEGKAPSPELHTVMKMIKEWMKGVYASITQLGRPMPDSTRILLNRHLGQGISARPGARAYVPHVSQFDTMMDTAPGGTRLAAGGNVVGVPQVDRRNFGARRNRGILWQSGELALSARPIIDQYFRRTKFMETEALRQELFDEGHPLPKNGRAPEGAWLVRNPQAAPERLSARNKSRLSEEDFSRLTGEGDTPEEFVTKMEEIRKDHYAAPGEHPEWANDLENVRWVEAGKINQRIQNVFPTAPRGRVAASAGSLNTMARLTGIYLRPLHYLVGNIPQNVLMVALTNPSALVNSAKYGAYSFLPRVVRELGMQPRDLFAHDRHLYNQIKTETGDIQAGAGLPDFYTMANNRFQKGERRLNKISQGSAEKLGELADQPYRVSVWIAHAKGYGYNTPDEWRELLNSERGTPEARIRDDIAQQTREDMIDFNTLSPGERQNVSRFFYLWAFTRGFAKWPLTFAREYPGRTGLAMLQSDASQTDDNGLPLSWLPASGVLKSNQRPGQVRDLGFLDPTGGLRQQIETGIQLAHGNFQGIGGMTTPPLETGLQAITGGPRAPKGGLRGLADQLARDVVPGYDIGRKAATPGLSPSARVSRALDFSDRFGVKPEIGRGKNAEKKRLEDEKIRRVLQGANRMDALPLVTQQQDAYWHHKYLEQQIRFGAQARRKGTALTNEEKLVILYATAAVYFPQANLPKLSVALKESGAYQEALRTALSDSMFGARNQVVNG